MRLDWGLQAGDVDDAEIEVTQVKSVALTDTISFGPLAVDENILVVGSAEVGVEIAFTHPDWHGASYDSETGILIPHDDISRTEDLTVHVEFSYVYRG